MRAAGDGAGLWYTLGMLNQILLALALVSGPLALSAGACPCNEKKTQACACPGGGESCPQTCAHDAGKKDGTKKDNGKTAPKKS